MLNRKLNSNTIILQSRISTTINRLHTQWKEGLGGNWPAWWSNKETCLWGLSSEKGKVSLVNLSSQICIHTAWGFAFSLIAWLGSPTLQNQLKVVPIWRHFRVPGRNKLKCHRRCTPFRPGPSFPYITMVKCESTVGHYKVPRKQNSLSESQEKPWK